MFIHHRHTEINILLNMNANISIVMLGRFIASKIIMHKKLVSKFTSS